MDRTAIVNNINTDDLSRRYLAGEPVSRLADSLGVSRNVIKNRLAKAGVAFRTNSDVQRIRFGTPPLDKDLIVSMYLEGKSAKAISKETGICRPTITDVLREREIPVRGRSEAMYLRMANTTPEQRLALAERAHAAVRGVPHSDEHRSKIATARETIQWSLSPTERTLSYMLTDRGLNVSPQKAVGRYNVDIAVAESAIAVEVFGGNWHASGAHASRYRKRLDYLLNANWLPVIVWVNKVYPLRPATADYIVALHEACRRGEADRGQEHVICGDPDRDAVVKREATDRPVVPSRQPRQDAGGNNLSTRK